jgi:hypothetical protein
MFLVKIKGTDAKGVRKILKLRGFMLRNPFPEDQYLAKSWIRVTKVQRENL